MTTVLIFILIAIIAVIVRYTYTVEVHLSDTQDALERSRNNLKSEREYIERLEKELLTYQPK